MERENELRTKKEPIADDLIERLRKRFASSPVQKHLRFEIRELEPDRAVLSMPFSMHVDNGSGTIHGGYLATLADAAVACALATNFDGAMGFATANLQIHYLRRAKTDVQAVAEVVKKGSKVCVGTVEIRDASGALCSLVTCDYVLTTSKFA